MIFYALDRTTGEVVEPQEVINTIERHVAALLHIICTCRCGVIYKICIDVFNIIYF